ncbi:hypothetical protein NV379_18640 [Paenibacillus sp. N1-5-1-14]|uniref:hypothetical protein n=1 Tax=Paenibacillus radicibacter TaxID=2972488 RepID=UPI0021591287|nr:hypothetical protein [Paenibacillus radicibacter]MCR8644675.1 hypothetical protein [Paenibacillus radicibacter]
MTRLHSRGIVVLTLLVLCLFLTSCTSKNTQITSKPLQPTTTTPSAHLEPKQYKLKESDIEQITIYYGQKDKINLQITSPDLIQTFIAYIQSATLASGEITADLFRTIVIEYQDQSTDEFVFGGLGYYFTDASGQGWTYKVNDLGNGSLPFPKWIEQLETK